ncbi:MAG: PAS domain-containing protein, partial [Bradymonadaceae bacterium]
MRAREKKSIRAGTRRDFEETIETDQGQRTFLTTNIPVGEVGEVQELIVIARDITERKQMRENLQQMAMYDHLTGLPNRALFYDRLEHAIER